MTLSSSAKKRCRWATNEFSIRYHDEEWGVPVHDDRILFEFLILEGAQAGLSWDTILKKRENYRVAFDGFDPAKIAKYDAKKARKLLANPGIIRNRLKVAAAIQNAKLFLRSSERIRQLRSLHLAIRWRRAEAESPKLAQHAASTHPRIRRHERRFEAPRLQIRRLRRSATHSCKPSAW